MQAAYKDSITEMIIGLKLRIETFQVGRRDFERLYEQQRMACKEFEERVQLLLKEIYAIYQNEMKQRDDRIAELERHIIMRPAQDCAAIDGAENSVSLDIEDTISGVNQSAEAVNRCNLLPRGMPDTLKRSHWKVFEECAAAGYNRRRLSVLLARFLQRPVSLGYVSKLLRMRWSPTSGSRFALRNAR